jgi:hypothetical protein
LYKEAISNAAPIKEQARMPRWLAELTAQIADDLLDPMFIDGEIAWLGEDTRQKGGTEITLGSLKQSDKDGSLPCCQGEHKVLAKDQIALPVKPEVMAELDTSGGFWSLASRGRRA